MFKSIVSCFLALSLLICAGVIAHGTVAVQSVSGERFALETKEDPLRGRIFEVSKFLSDGRLHWRTIYWEAVGLQDCEGSLSTAEEGGVSLILTDKTTKNLTVRVSYDRYGEILRVDKYPSAFKPAPFSKLPPLWGASERRPPYHPGWPITYLYPSAGLGQSLNAGNFFPATLSQELTLCRMEGVYAWNASGQILPGWPVDPYGNYRGASLITEGEFGKIAFSSISNGYRVYVYNHLGTIQNGWPLTTGSVMDSPMRANADADSLSEILCGSGSPAYFGYCWNPDATSLPGWPVTLSQNVTGSAVGDVNDDGQLELVCTSYSLATKMVWVISDRGEILFQWHPVPITEFGSSNSPVLADLDGDGDLEIILCSFSEIICWHHNGITCWGPVDLSPDVETSQIAVADLNNDTDLEIVIITETKVWVFTSDGALYPGHWPLSAPPRTYWIQGGNAEAPGVAVGDIDNDTQQEIVLNASFIMGTESFWLVVALNHDGSLVPGFPLVETLDRSPIGTPVIFDMDGDGLIEIASYGEYYSDPQSFQVSVYDLPYPYNPAHIDWPMMQHDPQRTGCYGGVGLDAQIVNSSNRAVSDAEFASNLHFTATPNPFNNETEISFYLPSSGDVDVVIYDVNGKEVKRLLNGCYPAGEMKVKFEGSQLPSGLYFAVLETDEGMITKKLILLK